MYQEWFKEYEKIISKADKEDIREEDVDLTSVYLYAYFKGKDEAETELDMTRDKLLEETTRENIQLKKRIKELEESSKENYWKGYIQKQNEAMEICKICKYKTKLDKLEKREQKVRDKLIEEKNTIETTYSQINGYYFMAQDKLDFIKEVLNLYKE